MAQWRLNPPSLHAIGTSCAPESLDDSVVEVRPPSCPSVVVIDLTSTPDRPSRVTRRRHGFTYNNPTQVEIVSQGPERPLARTSDAATLTSPPAKKSDSKFSPIQCAVCLDSVEKIIRKHGSQMVSLTCGHVFCQACIEGVFQDSVRCPTCRQVCRSFQRIYF